MKIKDTIKELGLDATKLPRVLSQRVNAVEDLNSRLAVAQSEYDENPTDENEEKLDEVKDYVSEYTDDVVSQLKNYRAKLEKKNQEPKKDGDGKDGDGGEPKEKKSSGAGLLLGAVVLVATLGAVNILRKK